MKIKYDETVIEVNEGTLKGLKLYAANVMQSMQKAEPEFAECWTACLITFDELRPEFQFGSKEDIGKDDGILVHCPLTE